MALKFGNTTVSKVVYNGVNIDKVIYNGTTVFESNPWDGSYTEFSFIDINSSSSRTLYLRVNVQSLPCSIYLDNTLMRSVTTIGTNTINLGTVSRGSYHKIRIEGTGEVRGTGYAILTAYSSGGTSYDNYLYYDSIMIGNNFNCNANNLFRVSLNSSYTCTVNFSPNYSYTTIGSYFLCSVTFTNIIIPKSITTINSYALRPYFSTNRTCNIVLPSGLTYPSTACVIDGVYGNIAIQRY